MKKKFFIKNFGCKINLKYSKLISNFLKKFFLETNNIEESELILLNTCYIRNKSFKNFINFIKNNNKKLYIIFGCISNLLNVYLIKNLYFIDIIIDSKFYLLINKIISYFYFYNCKQIFLNFNLEIENFSFKSFYIKISDGCNKYCSYCIVPYVKLIEKPIYFILIIKKIFYKNLNFICLISQNVNSYKNFINYNNFKMINFNLLIKYIFQIFNVKLINFISSHLIDYNKNFFNLIKYNKILNFIHLPIQSFSNNILILMKRNYKIIFIKNFLNKIKIINLNFSFSTDIIFSFPFEKNFDFYKNLIFLEKNFFEKFFFYNYNKRPFTNSCNFINNNLNFLKKKRIKKIFLKSKNKNKYFNKYYLSKYDKIFINFFLLKFNKNLFTFYKNKILKIFYFKFNFNFNKNFFKIKLININKNFFIGKIFF